MTTTPQLTIRRSNERGQANHGWLDSRFTFSFAEYHDPAHMGFRSLRVINDDRIAGGGGFPKHPHRDMEIFSYLLSGNLAHEDSLGNKRVLKPGEIQLMRAGSGVLHSEFNPSATETAHLLQIWILPDTRGLEPAYTEWTPDAAAASQIKTLVISADGRDGSATIASDASIYLLKLGKGDETRHSLSAGRGIWLHVATGSIRVSGTDLDAGDAVSLEEASELTIIGLSDASEAILFDLA